jgi:hypothetical protein
MRDWLALGSRVKSFVRGSSPRGGVLWGNAPLGDVRLRKSASNAVSSHLSRSLRDRLPHCARATPPQPSPSKGRGPDQIDY